MDKNTKSEFSFRRFIILLVTVLGGLYLLFTYLRVVAASIGLMALGYVLILRPGIRALRKGSVSINARTKFVIYTRADNPVEYWLYTFLFMIAGISICCFALLILLQYFKLIPNFLKIAT
ncbi:MAG TPA: hypothetical protein VIK35_10680 [Verrucomicrobiae bacterium]